MLKLILIFSLIVSLCSATIVITGHVDIRQVYWFGPIAKVLVTYDAQPGLVLECVGTASMITGDCSGYLRPFIVHDSEDFCYMPLVVVLNSKSFRNPDGSEPFCLTQTSGFSVNFQKGPCQSTQGLTSNRLDLYEMCKGIVNQITTYTYLHNLSWEDRKQLLSLDAEPLQCTGEDPVICDNTGVVRRVFLQYVL